MSNSSLEQDKATKAESFDELDRLFKPVVADYVERFEADVQKRYEEILHKSGLLTRKFKVTH